MTDDTSTAINLMELNDAEFIEHVRWHIRGISNELNYRLIALASIGASVKVRKRSLDGTYEDLENTRVPDETVSALPPQAIGEK